MLQILQDGHARPTYDPTPKAYMGSFPPASRERSSCRHVTARKPNGSKHRCHERYCNRSSEAMRPLSNARLLLLGRLVLVKGFHDDFLSESLPGTTEQIGTLAVPLLGGCEDSAAGGSMKNSTKFSPLNGKVATNCIHRGQPDQAKGMVDKDTESLRIPHLNVVLLVRISF